MLDDPEDAGCLVLNGTCAMLGPVTICGVNCVSRINVHTKEIERIMLCTRIGSSHCIKLIHPLHRGWTMIVQQCVANQVGIQLHLECRHRGLHNGGPFACQPKQILSTITAT